MVKRIEDIWNSFKLRTAPKQGLNRHTNYRTSLCMIVIGVQVSESHCKEIVKYTGWQQFGMGPNYIAVKE